LYYGDRAHSLESIALYRTDEQTLTDGGEPERLRIARVTPSLTSVLQTVPAIGRWFTADEGEAAPLIRPTPQPASRVAVMSSRLWMRRFGGDRAALSRPVSLGGVPTEIVGIMPRGFAFPDAGVDLWLPEQVGPERVWDTFMHAGVARLRAGVTVADARDELNSVIA